MTAGSIAVPLIIPLRAPVAGKLKNVIDTNTPIELKTETQNAEIYFTVDGSKPDPYVPLGVEKSTLKYTKPFKLRVGKRTVKAVGVSRDGTRESNIVTKIFDVEKAAYDEFENANRNDSYAFIDELEKEKKKETAHKRGILKKMAEINHNNSMRANDTFRSAGSLSDLETSNFQKETKYLGQRFSATRPLAKTNHNASFHLSNEELNSSRNIINNSHARIVLPDSSAQALRLQRETDFLKCIYCFANRPHDPFSRYCSECGKTLPQIPQNRLPPPEPGQLGKCVFCKSTVPLNTTICVVCENPMMPQLQPQASIKLQGKVICPKCTTGNPSNYSSCVACETRLPHGAKVHPVDFTVSKVQPAVKNVTCSQCFRMNSSDARFCDWCGAKPEKTTIPAMCIKCGANNPAHSKFCISCGCLVQPPSSTLNRLALTQSQNKANMATTWLNTDSKTMQTMYKQYETIATQTYGLYYPSSKRIDNTGEKMEKSLKIEKEYHDKRPLLTAISAGKGYWRQQMDHICAHLKAYAQNDAEFRASVGEPRLGKISIAKVDVDSNWCTVTATFPIRSNANKDIFNSSALIDHTLNNNNTRLSNFDYEMMHAATLKHSSSSDSLNSVESVDSDNSKRVHNVMNNSKAKKKFGAEKSEGKLTGEDRQLIKELSKDGRGRAAQVSSFLNEGANPNAKTKDSLSMLHLAISNKHFDCIGVLLDADADIKAKIPPKENTVLHEAVMLGGDCEKYIKILLKYGAQTNWKNKRDETPYDLAVKTQNKIALDILSSLLGESMLQDYLKSKNGNIKP